MCFKIKPYVFLQKTESRAKTTFGFWIFLTRIYVPLLGMEKRTFGIPNTKRNHR